MSAGRVAAHVSAPRRSSPGKGEDHVPKLGLGRREGEIGNPEDGNAERAKGGRIRLGGIDGAADDSGSRSAGRGGALARAGRRWSVGICRVWSRLGRWTWVKTDRPIAFFSSRSLGSLGLQSHCSTLTRGGIVGHGETGRLGCDGSLRGITPVLSSACILLCLVRVMLLGVTAFRAFCIVRSVHSVPDATTLGTEHTGRGRMSE